MKNELKIKQENATQIWIARIFEFSLSFYLIRYREESEVFDVLPFLEGDISLKGADISGQGWLQDPGN